MKKYFILVSTLWMVSSCIKEKTPDGLIVHQENEIVDSTYVITQIPAAQAKVIMVEEATGVRCTNCPDGALYLEGLKDQHPDRILSASVYSPFLNEFFPPSTHDFNMPQAKELVNLLGSDPSKPTAAIDRQPTGDINQPYFFNKPVWGNAIDNQLNKATPVNIELSTKHDGADYYTVKSKLTFTDTITASLATSIYLIEDSIINNQLIVVLGQHNNQPFDSLMYMHNHVLSKIITPVSGAILLSDVPTKERGRVLERSITFSLPENVVNKSNLRVVCFVHKTGASGMEILHAQEVDLD